MRHHPLKALLWFISIFVIVSLACGGPPATEEPTKAPKEQTTVQETEPKEEPETEEVPSSGAISNYQDARQAVIQIEAGVGAETKIKLCIICFTREI